VIKTRWYRLWLSGVVGVGPVVHWYRQSDPRIKYSGCKRLNDLAYWRVAALAVGETLELCDGGIVERVS
jgi:hypothetical protein